MDIRKFLGEVAQTFVHKHGMPPPLEASFHEDYGAAIHDKIDELLQLPDPLSSKRCKLDLFIKQTYARWDKHPSPSPSASRGGSRAPSVGPSEFPFHAISSQSPCSRTPSVAEWVSPSPGPFSREPSPAPSVYDGPPLLPNPRFQSVPPGDPSSREPSLAPVEKRPSSASFLDLAKRISEFKRLKQESERPPQKPPVPRFPRSRDLQAQAGTPEGAVVQGRPREGVTCPDLQGIITNHKGTFEELFQSLRSRHIYARLVENRMLLHEYFCLVDDHQTRVFSICGILRDPNTILRIPCERTKECIRFLVERQCVTEREVFNEHNFTLIMIAIIGKVSVEKIKLKAESELTPVKGILYRSDEIFELLYCVAPHLITEHAAGNAMRTEFQTRLTNPKRVGMWTLIGNTDIRDNDPIIFLYRTSKTFKKNRHYTGDNRLVRLCRITLKKERKQSEQAAAQLLSIGAAATDPA